jgi:hypothetical protein
MHMTEDEVFEGLPEEPELAFVVLESFYKAKLEQAIEGCDEGQVIVFHKRQYIHQVVASATALGIEAISRYIPPAEHNEVWNLYDQFSLEVEQVKIQIRIGHSNRHREFSVALGGPEKEKIRHYINQIKEIVDESDCSTEKKEAIQKRLSALLLEVDRTRTRFEMVLNGIRSLAALSGDVEREGAAPWWKWAKLIFGVVDEAKDQEESKSLPRNHDRKKLEAPRKQVSNARTSRDLDDEVPF